MYGVDLHPVLVRKRVIDVDMTNAAIICINLAISYNFRS